MSYTFDGKKNETSSKLNRVPPIGAPKATETPAAAAALNISRRLPAQHMSTDGIGKRQIQPTFIILILTKHSTNDVPDTAADVHEGAFLAQAETRGDGERQAGGFGEQSSATEETVDDETGQDGFDLRNSTARSLKINH